jgi:hypothetical protein
MAPASQIETQIKAAAFMGDIGLGVLGLYLDRRLLQIQFLHLAIEADAIRGPRFGRRIELIGRLP